MLLGQINSEALFQHLKKKVLLLPILSNGYITYTNHLKGTNLKVLLSNLNILIHPHGHHPDLDVAHYRLPCAPSGSVLASTGNYHSDFRFEDIYFQTLPRIFPVELFQSLGGSWLSNIPHPACLPFPLSHSLSLLVCPRITSQINYLHPNLCLCWLVGTQLRQVSAQVAQSPSQGCLAGTAILPQRGCLVSAPGVPRAVWCQAKQVSQSR